MILDRINKANDIKAIDKNDYKQLSEEIRQFILNKISVSGGHLASNLGVVELTMALHLALDFPNDKIVWDVGHQSYTHKILSGRKNEFDNIRSYGGMSGFPKRRESDCDCFDTGHSSTSISAALGIAYAEKIQNLNNTVVAVIGDGAFTGGMAFEALNNAASLKRNFIIILNDNNMSISENVGGLSTYLSNIRAGNVYNNLKNGVVNSLCKLPVVGDKMVKSIRKAKNGIKQLIVPGMLFENMGITYLGPVDGHNINKLVTIINEAKKLDHPVIIHVLTTKGKGYKFAENEPSKYHGVSPFNIYTGKTICENQITTYTDVVSKTLVELADKHKDVVAITAAMPDGTGLNKFKKKFPKRFFDVGIAEEHAVTFAAGLATRGLKPYFAVYSSFLQRAYDQMLHDVSIQDLPVVFLIDRAGIVGGDGETHQGIFDLSYLSSIPNMYVCAPKNGNELKLLIEFSYEFLHPLAIRYPRGSIYTGLKNYEQPIIFGKSEIIYKEKDIALFAVGNMVKKAVVIRDILKEKGYNVSLVNAIFVKPIDEETIVEFTKNHSLIVTLEENVINGGYGEAVLRFVNSIENCKSKILNIAIPNIYVEHGNLDVLFKEAHIDNENIISKITEEWREQ